MPSATPVTSAAPQAPARILRRRYFGSPMNTMLSQLQMQAAAQNKVLDEYGWTGRRVMGFKLPSWQRQEVWDDEQCLRFIESIWLGVGLGTYMVNMSERNKDADVVLLDGQQHMRAIERYLADELAMVGEDGNAWRWSQLTREEQAQFLRMPFPWVLTAYQTDDELRAAYNRHNFGGTAHRVDQRA